MTKTSREVSANNTFMKDMSVLFVTVPALVLQIGHFFLLLRRSSATWYCTKPQDGHKYD